MTRKTRAFMSEIITVRRDPRGFEYVVHPPSIKFFISSRDNFQYHNCTVEPLTLFRFIKAIFANLFFLNYWRLLHLLVWRLHAFKVYEGRYISWKDFKPLKRIWAHE